jgi:hypothetical protein
MVFAWLDILKAHIINEYTDCDERRRLTMGREIVQMKLHFLKL